MKENRKEELAKSRETVIQSRRYVELSDEELKRLKKLIRKSPYGNVKDFAEIVLMIHPVSLSRKLNKIRKFHFHEIELIEKTLNVKIEIEKIIDEGHR